MMFCGYLLDCAAGELNTSWMLHKTMLGAQAALICVSQGDIKSARDWLEGTTDEAISDLPEEITVAGLEAWFDSEMVNHSGEGTEKLNHPENALDMVGGWIKCGERMPEDDTLCLAVDDDGVVWTAHYDEGAMVPDIAAVMNNPEFTHWMPLPAAPQ